MQVLGREQHMRKQDSKYASSSHLTENSHSVESWLGTSQWVDGLEWQQFIKWRAVAVTKGWDDGVDNVQVNTIREVITKACQEVHVQGKWCEQDV